MSGRRIASLMIVLGLTMYGATWTCGALLSQAARRANAALIEAVLRDDVKAVGAALRMGADPDARDREADRPALQWAILCRRTRTESSSCSTSRVPAGPPNVVRLLLARGANPQATDRFGGSALEQARVRDFTDVVALLKQAGAQE